jgi:hypothetical protein
VQVTPPKSKSPNQTIAVEDDIDPPYSPTQKKGGRSSPSGKRPLESPSEPQQHSKAPRRSTDIHVPKFELDKQVDGDFVDTLEIGDNNTGYATFPCH